MRVLCEETIHGQPGEPSVIPPVVRQSLRILVVDDCHDNSLTLNMLCLAWGFESQCCFSGTAALLLAESWRPDVLLLDVAMPRISGNEVAQILRSQIAFQDCLLVAMSGYADQLHRAQSLECGFDQYIAKPAHLGELEKMLRARASWVRDRAELAVSVN